MTTRERFKKAAQQMIDDPKKARADVRAKIKREHPELTDEQIDGGMDVLKHTFGI